MSLLLSVAAMDLKLASGYFNQTDLSPNFHEIATIKPLENTVLSIS